MRSDNPLWVAESSESVYNSKGAAVSLVSQKSFDLHLAADAGSGCNCRNLRKQSVRTMLQQVVLSRSSDDLPVLKARQRSAFPPNFIHSIDSSHMMLTAIACAEEGAPFV